MILSDVSIKRPVFTAMVISAILVFGVVLYQSLRVDMYPEVNFPVITVTVVYAGADPETVEAQIADPIEEVVNGIAGVRSVRSTSVESVGTVIVEFDLDVDAASAAQEVRDRIATIQGQLPDGADAPMVQKLDLGAAPVMQLALSGPNLEALQDHARERLLPALERLDGVGQVDVLGGQDREVHVWIDPTALRGYSLTVSDVVNAIRAQSVDLPAGRIDQNDHELTLRTDASARTEADLAAIVLTTPDDVAVRLSDVARVESGFEVRRSSARMTAEGTSALVILVRKQSDANTVAVADAVNAELAALQSDLPSQGTLTVLVDNSRSIRSSLDTVQLDLLLGAVLAVAIILLFLRDFRATLISALALPVSVIGTFGFVQVMGFTLNMMTTLALSLSIGILIDDAIVVIENIVRRRTQLGEGPSEAAQKGTAEIGMAVLATTLSIVAVFVPVAFMEGLIGQFFFEFGLTVAFAVMLSLFVSFTLTPMLSARFLKAHAHDGPATGVSGRIGRVLDGLDDKYRGVVRWALRHRAITLALAVASLVATFAAFPLLGFEFVPVEDTGQFSVKIEAPRGTDLATMEARTAAAAAAISQMPWVDSTFELVGGGAQQRVDSSEIVVTMVDKESRDLHMVDAMAALRPVLAEQSGITAVVEPLTAMGGGARNAPIQIDLRGTDPEALRRTAEALVSRLSATPGFVDVDSSAELPRAELRVELDRERAADQGVNAVQLATTVRSLVAGEVATQTETEEDRVDVRVQLADESRNDLSSLERIQVRAADGRLVELGAIARVGRGSAPSQIDRENRQRQVSVYANIEDLALGDATPIAVNLAQDLAEPGVRISVGGSAKMLEESTASMGLALFLAVICVYMILAAQFESFIHPLTIMTSLPFALVGAVGGLLLAQMTMSIFAMIGLIMLMGLVTKNAILLVDFALQKIREGSELNAALEEAGATRLRPILMTTAAMIFGMLPVAIGHGDGGEVRAPMGVAVIGGLITSTVLTLVVVPVVHALIESAIRRVKSWRQTKPSPSLAPHVESTVEGV